MGDFIGNQPVPTVKGPRNYVQLSDGSTDLTFNSNVFVNSSGLIGNHITGDGTPTQLAFFDGSSSIASTPGASANVSSEQVEFSQTKGLRRLSSTFANSWEDGHLGNANFLIFTPSDFSNFTFRFYIPEIFGVAPGPPAGGSDTGQYGGVMENAASSSDESVVTAMKLLPKGFRVPTTNGDGRVWINNTSPGAGDFSVNIMQMDIVDAGSGIASTPTTLLAASVSLTNAETSFTTNSNSSTGNGSVVIIVKINVNLTKQLTADMALVGAKVPIERI